MIEITIRIEETTIDGLTDSPKPGTPKVAIGIMPYKLKDQADGEAMYAIAIAERLKEMLLGAAAKSTGAKAFTGDKASFWADQMGWTDTEKREEN